MQNNCAQALHVARRALEACGADGDAIASTSDGLLALREPVDVDLDTFEAAAARGAELRTVEMVRAALDLYAGELLPEDLYEDWTAARREAVREQHLRLLMDLAELHVDAGKPPEAIEALERAVVADPHHEGAHRALMRISPRVAAVSARSTSTSACVRHCGASWRRTPTPLPAASTAASLSRGRAAARSPCRQPPTGANELRRPLARAD